jgi:hypothetical protein
MTNSPEYPDLKWMPPASWTNANRTSVQLVVIHTTEGSEGPNSAEDGASYDQRRTDGTSTHFFHDSDSTVQCVRTEDQAHAARAQGNKRGIQHELCGRAGQGGAGWADPVSQGTLRQAARQCARDAKKWGIPVRKLSIAQVADGVKGFCGHVEITYAFPMDNGTHTDPGPAFPWTQFLDMVRAEMEDDMTKDELLNALKEPAFQDVLHAAVNRDEVQRYDTNGVAISGTSNDTMTWKSALQYLGKDTALIKKTLAALGVAVAGVDEAVWSRIPDPSVTAAEKADLLRAILGDDAAAVGALLAQPA